MPYISYSCNLKSLALLLIKMKRIACFVSRFLSIKSNQRRIVRPAKIWLSCNMTSLCKSCRKVLRKCQIITCQFRHKAFHLILFYRIKINQGSRRLNVYPQLDYPPENIISLNCKRVYKKYSHYIFIALSLSV